MKFDKLFENIFKGVDDTELSNRRIKEFEIDYKIDLENPEKNDWNNIPASIIIEILLYNPKYGKYVNWDNIHYSHQWAKLLSKLPQFAKYANWDSIYDIHLDEIFYDQPQLKKYKEIKNEI